MAKKSAGEAKIKKVEKAKVDPRKEFESFIDIEKMKIATELQHTLLPDSYIGMEKMHANFFPDEGTPSFEWVMLYIGKLRDLFSAMIDVLDKLDFDEFSKEEYADPYAGLVTKLDACENRVDVFGAFLCFSFIRPYGEHLVELWRLIREEIED